MFCVLGTLGSFCFSGPLSLAFRFLFSPEDFASPALLATVDGWTDCLTGKSPESSLDGLDDEYLLFWRGLKERAALERLHRGSAEPKVESIGDCGAAVATRRTDEGSMVPRDAEMGGFEGINRQRRSTRIRRDR